MLLKFLNSKWKKKIWTRWCLVFPKFKPLLTSFMTVILISSCHSKIFKLCPIFKVFIGSLLSRILVLRLALFKNGPKAGGRTIHSEIHKLLNSLWNNDELPQLWKKSITVPLHKTSKITDCSNYWGISLLSNTYKILSNIILSRLTPYADEIVGAHQCGFWPTRSTTDHIFKSITYLWKNGDPMRQCLRYL
jgi:hypothetical protein